MISFKMVGSFFYFSFLHLDLLYAVFTIMLQGVFMYCMVCIGNIKDLEGNGRLGNLEKTQYDD